MAPVRTLGWGAIQGVGIAPRAIARRLLVLVSVIAVVSTAAPPAHAQDSLVASQLEPIFEQIQAGAAPLVPVSEQVGAALEDLNATAADQAANGLGAAITQASLAASLASAVIGLAESTATVATSLVSGEAAALQPVAAEVAAAMHGGAEQLKTVVDTLAAQLAVAGAAGGAVGQEMCTGRDVGDIVLSLTPYGFAFEGVLVPFNAGCAASADAGVGTVNLAEAQPVFTELGAMNALLYQTLLPFQDVLRQGTAPACAVSEPVLLAGGLVPASAPDAPLPIGAAFAPVVFTCAFGEGPNAFETIVVVAGAAMAPTASFQGVLAGALALGAPFIKPFAPVLGPLATPFCGAADLLPVATAILAPLKVPTNPRVVISPVEKVACDGPAPTGATGDAVT